MGTHSPLPTPQGPQAPRQLGQARLEGRWLPGRGAAVAALVGARGAAAAERGGAVGVPHAHGGRGAPGGGKKGQVLVLAGRQLWTLGEHCQATVAQSAPTSGSRPGEKQRGTGDAQTGVTEQTVQIKMENQKEAGPPDSPGQEWRLDRLQANGGDAGGGHLPLKSPPSPEEKVLYGLSPGWSRVRQAGGRRDRRELRGGWRHTL